jgi:hypothetical protein
MVYPECIDKNTLKRRYTMTYEKDYTISEELMEEVCEQGFDALPELMRIVLNAAMYIERQKRRSIRANTRTARSSQWIQTQNCGDLHGQGHYGHPSGS